MCGRFAFTNANITTLTADFGLIHHPADLVPSYNIAPGQDVAVILNASPRELTRVRWGLVPSWAKDENNGYKMNNARCETVFEKPSFRHCIRKKRCLILADCFFEWKRTEDKKQPYCIRLKSHKTFAFAGLWDRWEKGANPLFTCSIVTCEPNPLMVRIHDRMPVIFSSSEDQQKWLSDCTEDVIRALMRPHDAANMEAYKISTRVNSPANQGKEILDTIE